MSQGLAADISALGRLTDRQSVLDYGLRDIVRRVQQVDGFNSYLEFESAMQALFREIQASISAQMQAGGPEELAKAKEMLLLTATAKAADDAGDELDDGNNEANTLPDSMDELNKMMQAAIIAHEKAKNYIRKIY